MAHDGQDGDDRQNSTDYRATYDRFMTITKWAVIGIAGALIVMAIFIV